MCQNDIRMNKHVWMSLSMCSDDLLAALGLLHTRGDVRAAWFLQADLNEKQSARKSSAAAGITLERMLLCTLTQHATCAQRTCAMNCSRQA